MMADELARFYSIFPQKMFRSKSEAQAALKNQDKVAAQIKPSRPAQEKAYKAIGGRGGTTQQQKIHFPISAPAKKKKGKKGRGRPKGKKSNKEPKEIVYEQKCETSRSRSERAQKRCQEKRIALALADEESGSSESLESEKRAKSVDDCESDADKVNSNSDSDHDFKKKEDSAVGMTDLERAYQDILNEPISPASVGGLKSMVKAFKYE